MLDFPATHKNRQPIAKVLADIFDVDREQTILEVASGSGQHICYFAQQFPEWTFQPSDLEPRHIESIDSFTEHHALDNVWSAKRLDAAHWGLTGAFDGILAINLIHISPWEATLGLLEGASRHLKSGGKLFLYGAYKRGGKHTSESNVLFDQSLQAQNPSWGVRCLDEVAEEAEQRGLALERVVPMPANNLSVVFSNSRH